MVAEIGHTGLAEWGGHITEEFLADLRFGPGGKAYAKYNEMRNNEPVIGALLAAIKQSVLSVSWLVESDEGEEDPRKELVEYAIDNMSRPLKSHVAEALTATVFGWAYFETIWKRDGSRLIWDRFADRGQDTLDHWEMDERGELLGMWQTSNGKSGSYAPVMIPIDKAIHYVINQEKSNPEGRSMLRSAYTSYYFLKNIKIIEAIGIERDLAGLPKITLPVGASTDSGTTSDKSLAEKLVRNVRNDEQAGVVIPDGWVFELLSSGGSRQFDTDKIITRYENRMLMAALAQFLMLGSDGVGSLALSRDQSDFFAMMINSLCDWIAETLTKSAIEPLLKYNGYEAQGIKLDHSRAGAEDIAALGAFLQQVGSLLTWTPQDEIWLRQAANMPDVDVDEIENDRAAKEERANAMAQALQQRQAQQEQVSEDEQPDAEDVEEDDEQMTMFAVSHADPTRRRHENALAKALRVFGEEQKKRVLSASRGLRNG